MACRDEIEMTATASKQSVSKSPVLRSTKTRRILVLSAAFPSRNQPVYGVFVKERVKAIASLPGYEVRVIAPVPFFPPLKWFRRWYPLSQVPRQETIDGLSVWRPRYPMLPKIGGYVHPQLMLRSVRRAVAQIGHDFDVIDAQFVYPDGVVATKLGRILGKPVVITARGEDIEGFSQLPIINKQIRFALADATQLVTLSRTMAEQMRRLGADPDKITVIPNGVDCDKFFSVRKEEARRTLGLEPARPLVLSVGYRLELKGFHILVDALPEIRRTFPEVLLAIVGGQARWAKDFLPVIEERIRAHGVSEHVLLTGNRPQEELSKWYSAADCLSILSSREGSPNVLMEALACGLPAVATPVGEIPEILGDERLGILLSERSAKAAANGLIEALSRQWNRSYIRNFAEQRTWDETAQRVAEVLERATARFRRASHTKPVLHAAVSGSLG